MSVSANDADMQYQHTTYGNQNHNLADSNTNNSTNDSYNQNNYEKYSNSHSYPTSTPESIVYQTFPSQKKRLFVDLPARTVSGIFLLSVVLLAIVRKNFLFTALLLILADQANNEVRNILDSKDGSDSKPHILKSRCCWRLIILACFISMAFIRYAKDGLLNSVWLLTTVAAVDIGAYFIGSKFGRLKIAPHISPNKTYAGLLGGWTAAVVLGLFFYGAKGNIGLTRILMIQTIITILAQLGDLYESALKRLYGVKNSSNIIPGHGGLLDRIDGFLFSSIFMAILVFIGAL